MLHLIGQFQKIFTASNRLFLSVVLEGLIDERSLCYKSFWDYIRQRYPKGTSEPDIMKLLKHLYTMVKEG
jgi:hypothetical protein